MRLVRCVLWVTALGAAVGEAADISWIDQEKIRAVYHYGQENVSERAQRLKRVGVNTVILKCSTEQAMPWLRAAKEHGLHAFPAFNFNVKAEAHGLRPAVLERGEEEAYACPLDERLWRNVLTPALLERASLAEQEDLALDGLWIDFELYSTRTGQRYYTRACYCDACFSAFCEHRKITTPALPPAERLSWLREKGLADEYQPFLQTRIEELARELRHQVHAVAPGFLLGFYPTPHNWSLIGVARAFSTPEVPIILWATDTYSSGGPTRVPDDWRGHYQAQGINARYAAGLLLRRYSAKNLAANLYQCTKKCDGYWLFTSYTLNIPEEEQKGDYYLAAGSPDQYWDAIARGNQEIVRAQRTGSGFRSDLTIGPEPVILRALSTPTLKKRLAVLRAPEVPAETIRLPEVRLRGQNLLIVRATPLRKAQIHLRLIPVGAAKGPIRWQALSLEGDVLGEATGKPEQDVRVAFRAPADGLAVVVASAGSARWYPAETNAAVGLYAAKPLHIMGHFEKLYTSLPANAGAFSVNGKGSSSRERVRIRLIAPDGTLVGDAQSDATAMEATVKVPAERAVEGIWTIEATKADGGILEDYTIEVPGPLPPVLSLRKDMVFR